MIYHLINSLRCKTSQFPSSQQRRIGNKENHYIRGDYIHRTSQSVTAPYVDSEGNSAIYQVGVYDRAKALHTGGSVLDIGCGAAVKLTSRFPEEITVGLEIEPGLSWLQRKYPSRRWLPSDFSEAVDGEFDIIICSDVIEHLHDPESLLAFIGRHRFRYAVISTPDRASLTAETGPPRNPAHIREWNEVEFKALVGDYFSIREQFFCPEPTGYHSQCVVVQARA